LRWHLVHSAVTMLPRAFGDADFEFFGRVLLGQRDQQPRWRLCLSQTDEYLGDTLGRGFVEETFRSEAMTDTAAMIGYLKAALRHDIETATWMSEATRRAALDKLAALQERIGHPDKWRDVSALRISRTDAFGNLQRVRAAENARDVSQIGLPADPAAWPVTPQTANSGYIATQNTILFPAGILQPPIYDAARDAAVNYGAAASLIGHELTHGFDDTGRRFDAKGNVRDWWTPADAKAFEERTACIVDEYSQFVVAGDTRINGKLTLGENIADNGGLRLALMAYFAGPGSAAPPALDHHHDQTDYRTIRNRSVRQGGVRSTSRLAPMYPRTLTPPCGGPQVCIAVSSRSFPASPTCGGRPAAAPTSRRRWSRCSAAPSRRSARARGAMRSPRRTWRG